MTDTINNGIPFVPENTIDPAAGLNLSLNVIDALLQLSVASMGQTTPPAGVEGERHIVGVGATGDWAGQDNKLARYLDGMWHFYDAKIAVYDSKVYAFDGTDWATALVGDDLKTINGQSIIGSGDLTVTGVVNNLNDVGDVDAPTPSDGDALVYNSVSGNWEATTVGSTGTVTSVDITVPTGFTISGNPITGAGTLALDFDTGYSLVSSADRAMWDAALQSSDLKTVNGKIDSNWLDHTIPALNAQYPGLNVKDVCFYDTTKDSDGGAWTKRTGSLSYGKEARPSGRYLGQFTDTTSAAAEGLVNDWYYNTTSKKFYQLTDVTTPAAIEIFRAGSAEFPSQVVIVAERTRVIIFDASGSELTMWMVFLGFTSYVLGGILRVTAGSNGNALIAREGVLAISANRDQGGLVTINMVAETANYYTSLPYNRSTWTGEFTKRNILGTGKWGYNPAIPLIVSHVTTGVAITVLPNAPTNPLTGLRVPTILVATDNGWSLITDSGVAYDGQVGSIIKSVSFGPDNEFYTVTDTGVVSVWNNVADIVADGIPADSTVSNVLGTPTVIEGVV